MRGCITPTLRILPPVVHAVGGCHCEHFTTLRLRETKDRIRLADKLSCCKQIRLPSLARIGMAEHLRGEREVGVDDGLNCGDFGGDVIHGILFLLTLMV